MNIWRPAPDDPSAGFSRYALLDTMTVVGVAVGRGVDVGTSTRASGVNVDVAVG